MRLNLLFLSLALIPVPLLAQTGGIALGAGFGFTGSQDLSGGAFHAQLSVPIARIDETKSVRAEALFQQGTIAGSPTSCKRVEELHCLGRTDRNRIAGVGAHLRVDISSGRGPVRAYLTPIGIGVYHRRTESTETQGPTGVCIVDGQVTSCASNPPFKSLTEHRSATALGWNTGAGIEIEVFGVRAFMEARLHDLLDGDESRAGATPLTVGITF